VKYESDPDRPARAAEPVRVARFDSLEAATDDESRVAGFDELDAGAGDRSLAKVISLDSVAGRRVPGAERHARVVDGAGSAEAGDDGLPPDGPLPRGRRTRQTRRSDEALGETVPGGPRRPEGDGGTDDGLPPDGPLPRGRRRRARVGRLGPDAPDPELPEPEADPAAIAREICLRLLTDRARTRQELAQALARKGVPAKEADEVLDRFDEVGLIDDAAFAGQWVRSRHVHRGLGRRAIAVELRRKGVADDVAGEALAEVDAESEDRRARELVDRKLRSLAVGTPDERATAARRLIGMLARKGYGAGTAYRVVRAALAEHGADAGELHADVPDE
jgi:regulatory protein